MTKNLGFGLNGVVPDAAEAAWGARLIIYPTGGVDLVHDRTSALGSNAAKARLGNLLNERLPFAKMRDAISAKIRSYEISLMEPAEILLYEDPELKVVGNSNGSHGYFYVAAWAVPEDRWDPDEEPLTIIVRPDGSSYLEGDE